MTITKDRFGFLDAGMGAIPKSGVVADFSMAAKLGLGSHQLDQTVPWPTTKNLDYTVATIKAADDKHIKHHLLCLSADPAWVKSHPREYDAALKTIRLRLSGFNVDYMIGREPIYKMTAEAYRDWLNASIAALSGQRLYFGCIPRLEEAPTFDWIRKAHEGVSPHYGFAFNWHGDAFDHVWEMAGAVAKLRGIIGRTTPLLLAETGTWGAANTVHSAQTNSEQAFAYLGIFTLALALGVERVYGCPALQDSTASDSEFYGWGWVDKAGYIKSRLYAEYIADMTQ